MFLPKTNFSQTAILDLIMVIIELTKKHKLIVFQLVSKATFLNLMF